MLNISKFYTLTPAERINALVKKNLLTKEHAEFLSSSSILPSIIADNLIENQVTQFSLPFGIGLNFVVNHKSVLVPMVTEESSVIAACSYAAKLASRVNGFIVDAPCDNLIEGQIIIETKLADKQSIIDFLSGKKLELIAIANHTQPSLIKRGGGVQNVQIKAVQDTITTDVFVSIYLTVDTKDAMGANIINSMLECCAKQIEQWLNISIVMSILSNYSPQRLYQAHCKIKLEDLKTKYYLGAEVARKIILATNYANLDIYRATTHNKGIMNGVNAVVVATGNDSRAVEASVHAYACKNGRYQSLSHWQITQDNFLEGSLSLPLPIGVVGGATKLLPVAKFALDLANIESVQDLGAIIASVGLAQNLAALKALVTDGIQKGHMRLHARNIAISVGANENEISRLSSLLKKEAVINTTIAKTLLNKLREEKDMRSI